MIFKFKDFNIKVKEKSNQKLKIIVEMQDYIPFDTYKVEYVAASPSKNNYLIDVSKNIPFENREIAFENTPNKGSFKTKKSKFSFEIIRPNCFYTKDGKRLIPSYLEITINGTKKDINLNCLFNEKKIDSNTPKMRLRYNKTQEDLLKSKSI